MHRGAWGSSVYGPMPPCMYVSGQLATSLASYCSALNDGTTPSGSNFLQDVYRVKKRLTI